MKKTIEEKVMYTMFALLSLSIAAVCVDLMVCACIYSFK